jgi:hypothetical protein
MTTAGNRVKIIAKAILPSSHPTVYYVLEAHEQLYFNLHGQASAF